MRLSLKTTGLLFLLILSNSLHVFAGCSAPQTIIIPADREISPVPGKEGWFFISAGHMRSLYEENRTLLYNLEKCEQKLGK